MGWCPGQPRVGLFEGDAGGVWPPRSLSPPAAQFLRLGWRWLSVSAGALAPRSLVRDRPRGQAIPGELWGFVLLREAGGAF